MSMVIVAVFKRKHCEQRLFNLFPYSKRSGRRVLAPMNPRFILIFETGWSFAAAHMIERKKSA